MSTYKEKDMDVHLSSALYSTPNMTSSCRVIQFVPEPIGGGAQLLARELARRLPAYGIESTAVYIMNKQGVELRDNEHCLNLSSATSPLAPVKLRNFLKRFGDERTVVHGHLTIPLYYLGLPGVAGGCRRVYTEHNTYNRRRDISALRWVEKLLYGCYEKIICISDATRDELLKWIGCEAFGPRTEVIDNGGRLFSLKSDRKRDAGGIRLVSVGTLLYKKGFDIALQAVAQLRCPVARYVIIGEGSERASLEKQALSLGLGGVVQFVGWQDDVEKWLHTSDLQLIPSRWEGFGLMAVEGLSTGLPIVASDVPGLNQVLGGLRCARLVEVESPLKMAGAIEEFYDQFDELGDMAEVARQRAEMYGLDTMVRKYARVYREVLDDR